MQEMQKNNTREMKSVEENISSKTIKTEYTTNERDEKMKPGRDIGAPISSSPVLSSQDSNVKKITYKVSP